MDAELLFRILFLIVFLPGVTIRAYYTRKVQAAHRKLSMKERLNDIANAEGKANATLLIVQGTYLIIILPLYLLYSPNLPWSHLPIPDLTRWLGVGLGILCLPFLAWVHYVLDKHWSISVAIQEKHTLVTSGPYRRIRHPMYTIHMVYFFTWVLVSADLLFLINYIMTILLISSRIPREERMLLDQFGEEYHAYMERTGRLLPRLHQGRGREKEKR